MRRIEGVSIFLSLVDHEKSLLAVWFYRFRQNASHARHMGLLRGVFQGGDECGRHSQVGNYVGWGGPFVKEERSYSRTSSEQKSYVDRRGSLLDFDFQWECEL